MKRYFGEGEQGDNPYLPKEMAFEIFKKLSLSEKIKSQTVCKDWKQMLRNERLYRGLGVKSYDELKQHAFNMKSFFGRFLFNKILRGEQEMVATTCTQQEKDLESCECSQGVSGEKLTWHLLYKIDQKFLELEGSVKDGFDGYLYSDWAMWCYEEVAGAVMDNFPDQKRRFEFYSYCKKFDPNQDIPRFYTVALKEANAIKAEPLNDVQHQNIIAVEA